MRLDGLASTTSVTLTARYQDAAGQKVTDQAEILVQPVGQADQLSGAPDDPVQEAIPELRYRALADDYRNDLPDLGGLYLSPRVLLMVFANTTTVADANALLRELEADIVGGFAGAAEVPGILLVRVSALPPTQAEARLARLRDDTRLRYVVFDGLLEASSLPPRGPDTPADWTWERVPTGGNYGLELLRVPQLWNLNPALAKESATTRVGLIDVGFAASHEDLRYAGSGPIGREADHGSHAAGIIAAIYGNSLGIDGIHPAAELVRYTRDTSDETVFDERESFAEALLNGYVGLRRDYSDLRVINLGLSYPWGATGRDPATSSAAQTLVRDQAALVDIVLRRLQNDLATPTPMVVVAAGNDATADAAPEARWSSPFAYAGLALAHPSILVVEALRNDSNAQGGASRAGFSNRNGHLSAPGDALSTVLDDSYALRSGTSVAASHVSGVLAYLYALDPTLQPAELRTLLQQTSITVAGGASNRLDAFAVGLELDTLAPGSPVLRRLLDIDDGSRDGNQRVVGAQEVVSEDLDSDGGSGDGTVDMADFRRWRDWLLQIEADPSLVLDGRATHPKKDVNGNGVVEAAEVENRYPRGDFNGDGRLSRQAAQFVGGDVAATASDLAVLQFLFDDPDYDASELPGLIDSADLDVWPERCLAISGVTDVETRLVSTTAAATEQTRRHDATTPRHLLTLPVATSYQATANAFDRDGNVVATAREELTLQLGQDLVWNPSCETPTPTGPTGPTGSSWGDPHLISFDGLQYSLQLVGEFVLAQSADPTASDALVVQIRQQPWRTSRQVSVNTALATRIGAEQIGFDITRPQPLTVDGSVVDLSDGDSLALGSGQLTRDGESYQLVYPTGEILDLVDRGDHLSVRLTLNETRRGTMRGLLGNADGSPDNDLLGRDGQRLSQPPTLAELYNTYAESWRVVTATSMFSYPAGTDTETFTDRSFPDRYASVARLSPDVVTAATETCSAAGVAADTRRDACVLDVGLTGEPSFAAAAARQPTPQRSLAPTLPDLTIQNVGLSLAEDCQPFEPLLYLDLTVLNQGTAASLAQPDTNFIRVTSTSDERWRSTSAFDALAAGASRTLRLPILYPPDTTDTLSGEQRFVVDVDPNATLLEARLDNNRRITSVVVPNDFCGKVPSGPRIALLHGEDTRAATLFEAQLEARDLVLNLVSLTDARNADTLSVYDVFLIDPLSAAGDIDAAVVTALEQAGRPFVGIGSGGYEVLGRVGSSLASSTSTSGSDLDRFVATTPLHPSLVGPRPISLLLGGETLRVRNTPKRYTAIDDTAALTCIGTLAPNGTRCPNILDPNTRTALWGFDGLPSDYTEDGFNALANLIDYIATLP